MVLPMLGIVYYGDNHGVISASHEMSIVVATLGGSIIGQLFFGIAAEYVWVVQTILIDKYLDTPNTFHQQTTTDLNFTNSKFGRRKMYGWELVVTIFATIGVATASYGVNGSLSILGGLIAYRIILGFGIGADYPLSAVICSEYAL